MTKQKDPIDHLLEDIDFILELNLYLYPYKKGDCRFWEALSRLALIKADRIKHEQVAKGMS